MSLEAKIKKLNESTEVCFACNGTGWYFNDVPCILCAQTGKQLYKVINVLADINGIPRLPKLKQPPTFI